jgi:hypothetical protein
MDRLSLMDLLNLLKRQLILALMKVFQYEISPFHQLVVEHLVLFLASSPSLV